MENLNITQAKIEYIIEMAESAYVFNKLPHSRKKNYLVAFKTYLMQNGIIKNICPHCLGTGRNKK